MKYNGWLIYNHVDKKQNESYINWFIREAEAQGIFLELVFREDLTIGIIDNKEVTFYKNRPVSLPDFAVVRTIDPLLSRVLETLGIRVFNSSHTAAICNDKSLTHHHVNHLSIPMTDTVFINRCHPPTAPPMAYPFVLKDPYGRGGKQVQLISDSKEWEEKILQSNSNQLIMQSMKYIQPGRDVRVFVVGKEIIGAVMRSSDRDFRSNFKLGGNASWYNLNAEEINVINQIINAFDFDMVGVDFLIDDQGKFLFNEVEDVVGSRTLSKVSDINILEKYIAHINNQLDRQSK